MKFADRVKETTTTTGTGTLTLAGAATGFRTFLAALTDGDLVPYVIEAANGTDWETGIGTYSAGTLARTTVTASSNAGDALDLAAGTHTVYLGMIARAARDIDYATPVSVTAAETLTSAAVGRHHVCTGTTADYEVDLPTSGLAAGDLVSFEMAGALTRLVTLDAGASALIDGERYRVLWARETCVLKWDGTGWAKVSGKSIPMSGTIGNAAGNNQIISNDTVTKVATAYSVAAAPATMVDTSAQQIVIKRSGQYRIGMTVVYTGNAASGLAAVANSHASQARLNKNGTVTKNYKYYFLAGDNTPFFVPATVDLTLVAGDYLELYAYISQLAGSAETTKIYAAGNGTNYLSVSEIVVW